MTEHRVDEILERDGLPVYHVVVDWPEKPWLQTNGKPVSVEFSVYAAISRLDDGRVLYERRGWQSSDDMTTDLADANRVVEGTVKWDGCANYAIGQFDNENRLAVMQHACDPNGIEDLFRAVRRGYEIAAGMVDALTQQRAG